MTTSRPSLKAEIDRIIRLSHDNESAHGAEDALHLDLIAEFCPDWVVAEIDRLTTHEFTRWYA